MPLPVELRTFDDVRALIRVLPQPDGETEARARARQMRLTKPPGSLGRLEDLACWLAAWQRRDPPRLERVRICVFAGNHGVAARGVSAYPASVTAQMVANFEAGGAAINQLARTFDAELRVVPLALDHPTADFTAAPALDEAACVAAIRAGFACVEPGLDLVVGGEMGIANTTAAAAVLAALSGEPPEAVVGPGTGLDRAGIARKVAVVRDGLTRHRAALGDPLEVLRRLGGREIAALFGLYLGARIRSVPAVLDGFVTTAAAAVLHALAPEDGLSHLVAGHRSAEPAHRRQLARLGLEPLLDLGMRLGEGSGAAVALGILRAAVACHAGMATFEEAGVDDRRDG